MFFGGVWQCVSRNRAARSLAISFDHLLKMRVLFVLSRPPPCIILAYAHLVFGVSARPNLSLLAWILVLFTA
jgi:hypothetical protein